MNIASNYLYWWDDEHRMRNRAQECSDHYDKRLVGEIGPDAVQEWCTHNDVREVSDLEKFIDNELGSEDLAVFDLGMPVQDWIWPEEGDLWYTIRKQDTSFGGLAWLERWIRVMGHDEELNSRIRVVSAYVREIIPEWREQLLNGNEEERKYHKWVSLDESCFIHKSEIHIGLFG